MQPGTLKTLMIVLALSFALRTASLRAQTDLLSEGTGPITFEFRTDGTLIAKGTTGTGTLLSTDQGAGTRMLWFPDLAAFRAGTISSGGTQWNLASIGQYSVAFGTNTTASGTGSAAFGQNTMASGTGSAAFGWGSTASGAYSLAFGDSVSATATGSLAFGHFVTASGQSAVAFYGSASGSYSFAAAFGGATGTRAVAFGLETVAASLNSFAIGTYNVGGGSATSWVATDPLFEIGNGTSTSAKADAFVVYKNGTAAFQGVVTVAPGGDIPMYTGN